MENEYSEINTTACEDTPMEAAIFLSHKSSGSVYREAPCLLQTDDSTAISALHRRGHDNVWPNQINKSLMTGAAYDMKAISIH